MTSRFIKLGLISSLTVTVGCDCHQNVSGTIIEDATNQPIENVRVYKIRKEYDESVTDENGKFQVSSISGGLFGCPAMKVVVAKEGYASDTVEIENAGSKTIRLVKIKEKQ